MIVEDIGALSEEYCESEVGESLCWVTGLLGGMAGPLWTRAGAAATATSIASLTAAST